LLTGKIASTGGRVTCTRIKICGITRVEDAEVAAEAGADAIGLVFYPPSPRCVDFPVASTIASAVGPFVTKVALMVNPLPSAVEQIISQIRPDLLQFHGDETAEFCDSFSRPWIKAIRMRTDTDPIRAMAAFPGACGFLFDTWHAEKYGGTGVSFDWDRLPADMPKPVILAGGLTPDTVAEAVRRVRPYAVDVSGGVERQPGIKDPELIRSFIHAVKNA